MSKRLLVALALLCMILVACGASLAPPPAVTPPAAVAISPPIAAEQAPAAAAEAVELDPGDPGPVPVSAADPTLGDRDAPVTIVEFADFQCPFCGRAQATMSRLEEAYGPEKLRIVWK